MAHRLRLLALITLLFGTLLQVPATATGAPESALRWQRCSPGQPAKFQCATVLVPMDYANPRGRKLEVRISRLSATDPAKRRGVLLMNPGGPGAPGLDMPLTTRFPKAVTDRYDRIGFDPRGVGQSTPVGCGTREVGWGPVPFDPATFDDEVGKAKRFADACRAAHPTLLPFITTRNTARDLDQIRRALGEDRISYYGGSYGTYLGAVYSQLFRTGVDRMVLDSSVDPERAWRGMLQIWAIGAQRRFDHFARWAAERDATYRLGSTPLQVDLGFRKLLRDLDRRPITVDGFPYDGNEVRGAAAGIGETTEANEIFADLLRSLRRAQDRGAAAATMSLTRQALPMRWQLPPRDNSRAALLAVICGDAQWPTDPRTYRADALRDTTRFPILGAATSNIQPCAFWPKSREPRTEIADNNTPLLMVQNSLDPTTPVEGARNLHRLLPRSKMVLVRGAWRHGAYPGPCTRGAVDRYLSTGVLPANDVTCTARR